MDKLFDVISRRKSEPIEGSYTNYLLESGIDKIGKKVGEEAVELIIAAKNKDKSEIISEAADLLYHVSVLLVAMDVEYGAVAIELEQRCQKIGNLKAKNQKGEL
ncbi:MAG: phosphoribosyl-ATP diphosphatase [Culicoidibacterales bacterium]